MDRENDASPSVAVVGAGVSGLTLAGRLTSAGARVTVFEKSRGPGGRMATRRGGDRWRFDHGAQYFTVRDPVFRGQVDAWIGEGVVAEWRGRIGSLRRGRFGSSDRPTRRYVGAPGMNAIGRRLAEGVDLVTGAEVDLIESIGAGWRLSVAGESKGEFDAVVVSAPAPQSARLLRPAEPLASRAAGVAMSGCWAAMLGFEAPLDLAFDGAFVEDSPLSWIARDTSKPGRNPTVDSWVVHASPEWSAERLEAPPTDVLPILMEEFWRSVGCNPRAPAHAAAHRWRYALPPEPLEDPFLFDAGLLIGACGDWCGGPRVEGAFLSGWSLADRLITALDRR